MTARQTTFPTSVRVDDMDPDGGAGDAARLKGELAAWRRPDRPDLAEDVDGLDPNRLRTVEARHRHASRRPLRVDVALVREPTAVRRPCGRLRANRSLLQPAAVGADCEHAPDGAIVGAPRRRCAR